MTTRPRPRPRPLSTLSHLLLLLILPLASTAHTTRTHPHSVPTTPQNPHFSNAHLSPWLPYTSSGASNVVEIASPGHNASPYCALLAAASTAQSGGYASLAQDFGPVSGVMYSVSFAYRQTTLNATDADEGESEAATAPAGSITFGILDSAEEAYLFAETVTMYPFASGLKDSLGNKPGVWHAVTGGRFTGTADLVSYSVVLEPAGVGKSLTVEVDDLVVVEVA